VIGTLATDNLAIGVVAGVLTAMVAFARRVAHMTRVHASDAADGVRTYTVSGELFWASSNDLVYQFDYAGDPDHVVIDLTDAEVWDASTVATFDSVLHKYSEKGKTAQIVGLDGASLRRVEMLSGKLGDC
jgi:SulP family sulfate permease